MIYKLKYFWVYDKSVTINVFVLQIALLHQNPQLKQYVRPAIERSVQELLPPVVERSIKIALTTCEQIVRKVRSSDILTLAVQLHLWLFESISCIYFQILRVLCV